MGFWSSLFGDDEEKDATSSTEKTYRDPLKEAVASPLSSYLASQIGKGIGEYTPDSDYTNRYSEFMKVDPVNLYQKSVAEPITKLFKEDYLPVIREGFAGNLRGSGRYGAEESGLVKLATNLSTGLADFVPDVYSKQMSAGEDKYKLDYQNWYQGLAQNNPVLKTAIDFLSAGTQTGTGTETVTQFDYTNWMKELLNAAVTAAGAYATSQGGM
jgi:hypothetical protein